MFGISSRFGSVPAQIKAFMDATGGHWMKGALVGKAAGTFVSTGTQAGGQENCQISMISFFAHHGMVSYPTDTSTPRSLATRRRMEAPPTDPVPSLDPTEAACP